MSRKSKNWPALLMQPAGSSLCGQACCAMLAKPPKGVEEIATIYFSHRHNTHWYECWRALIGLGLKCGPLTRGNPEPGTVALCRIKFDQSSRSHFVVFNRDFWLDPDRGPLHELPSYDRVTNHMKVS